MNDDSRPDVSKGTPIVTTIFAVRSHRRTPLSSTVGRRLLLLSALALLALLAAPQAALHAEEVDDLDASDYVEVFDGDMPLMLAVGHGGWKQVGEQENGCYSADPLLQDYAYQVLAKRILEKTGHLPYIVYQQGDRNYVNTNRAMDNPEAFHPDNTEAQAAYFEFHNQMDAMIWRIENRYGSDMGLLINPHTTDLAASRGSCPWDRIAEIGYVASVTDLGSSVNTMRALYGRKGEAAIRGEDSIPYQLFHGQDWPDASAVWPAAATANSKTLAQTGDDVWHVLPAYVSGWDVDDWTPSYFNGSWTVVYHGTNTWGRYADWANGLDAFQMEVNYTKETGIALDESGAYQLDVPFTTELMDDLIDAILHSLWVNYNWTPGGVYNVVVDNGDVGFSTTGTWAESSGEGFWGTPSAFTDQAGATATWTPDLHRAGTYEVLVRWTRAGDRTPDALYTVNYGEGSQTFTVDQGGGQDAKWISLGWFRFDSGTGGNVVLEYTGAGESAAADAVMFRHLNESGIIVDNLDTGFSTTGEWEELDATFEYAGSSFYANEDGATATWTPDLPEAGDYMVLAWWPYQSEPAQQAPYTIVHANGSHTAQVNQRQNAGRWIPLGVYEFDAGTAGHVTVTREAGDGTSTSADAVRFFKIVSAVHLPGVIR